MAPISIIWLTKRSSSYIVRAMIWMEGILFGDDLGGLDPVFLGHPEVHENDIGFGRGEAVEEFLAVLCFLNELDSAIGTKGQDHSFPEYLVVIGNGNFNNSHSYLFGRASCDSRTYT